MAADDFTITNGDVRMRVEGLGKTMRALAQAGAESESMRDLMHSLGMVVVQAARPRTPVLDGRLQGTIRAGRGKTKAVVRAGGARAPYAGVIHYGWPARNIKASAFLTDALASTRSQILAGLDEGLGDLLKKNNLK